MNKLTGWQKQIITGAVLGGSSLIKPKLGTNYYFSMRNKDKLWLQYKIAELEGFFLTSKLTKDDKTYRARSMCSQVFTEMHGVLYESNQRKVTKETLDLLRDIGLAIWYLEGGGRAGRNKKNAYLNTTKLGEDGTELVKEYFNDEIIDMKCNIHKNGERIKVMFTVAGTIRLFSTIAHRFPAFMYNRINMI